MKKASLLLFGIVWCCILAVITWLFSCSTGVGKSSMSDPYGYGRWMMYTFFSGFWAFGVLVVASGLGTIAAARQARLGWICLILDFVEVGS